MGGNKAKVANYGTSRVVDSNATMSMMVMGTPIYMAPEILSGERYSFAADVYSFGLTMYAVCDRVRFVVVVVVVVVVEVACAVWKDILVCLIPPLPHAETSLQQTGAPASRPYCKSVQ